MISRFTISDPTRAGTAAGAHQTPEICQSRLRYRKCSVLERLMQDTLLENLGRARRTMFCVYVVVRNSPADQLRAMVSRGSSVLAPEIPFDAV